MEHLEKRVDTLEDDVKDQQRLLNKLSGVPDMIAKMFGLMDEFRTLITDMRIDLALKRDKEDCNSEHDRCLKKGRNNINSKERKAYLEVIKALAIGLSSSILALLGFWKFFIK